MQKIATYMRLMRPSNLVTTLSDVLLGFAIAGLIINIVSTRQIFLINIESTILVLLSLSSACLYTGGVVLNDLYDAEEDSLTDPTKPIPSGNVSKKTALTLGTLFTIAGITAAFAVSMLSGVISILISLFAFLYNFYKNQYNIGGFCMGMCRSLNMLLGMSLMYDSINQFWYLAFLPLIYIGMTALLSSGEMFGSVKSTIETSLLTYSLILITITSLTFTVKFRMIHCLPFLILFVALTLPGLLKVHNNPDPILLKKVAKKTIHSFFILEAAIASGFSGYEFGFIILLLLPLAIVISRIIEESDKPIVLKVHKNNTDEKALTP